MIKLLQLFSIAAIPILIFWPIPNNAFTICPFFYMTSLPCPACGLGRSLIHLYHLDLLAAFYYNPFGYLVFMGQWYSIATLFFTDLIDLVIRKYNSVRVIGFSFLIFFVAFGLIRIWFIFSGNVSFSQYFYTFQ